MVGLGVDSVGLATTLLEHTMVTKGGWWSTTPWWIQSQEVLR